MMEPADFRAGDDGTDVGGRDWPRVWRVLVEGEMRPRSLVVRDIGAEEPSQMAFVEHDDVVEALTSDRSDDSFDIGILPGRSRCRANDRQAERRDRAVERGVEDRIAVVQNKARRRDLAPGKRFAELLPGPRRGGVLRHTDVQDTATVVCQDHQHVQNPTREGGYGAEIDGDERADVIREEGAPGLGRGPMTARQEPRHSPLGDGHAQL